MYIIREAQEHHRNVELRLGQRARQPDIWAAKSRKNLIVSFIKSDQFIIMKLLTRLFLEKNQYKISTFSVGLVLVIVIIQKK